MATIDELKERSVTETPLLLFDCELTSGAVERWSTHQVQFEGQQYEPRVLQHNLFEFRAGSDDGADALARISVSLANADSHFSQIERTTGWKGSKITVRFVFFDLRAGAAASEAAALFRGIADAPEEITESTFRLTVNSSLSLQRVALPDVRVEKRCPWRFPLNGDQRAEGVLGGARGKYSPLYRCGYSPDQDGGVGNLDGGGAPYATCKRTRAECEARGMFSKDSSDRTTARFGGIEYVPSSTKVRSYGDKEWHVADPVSNEARYNDYVPLIYGTVWYSPLIVFSKNDGNLTRIELLLGMGEMNSVLKVVVNGAEIPLGKAGANMSGTGWFSIVTPGTRWGGFNLNFADGAGQPLGDPYGSMAMLSVVVPNRVNDGKSLPKIEVLAEGIKLDQFDEDGEYQGESFTNNPAWVLLDILRRSGWTLDDVDVPSFARAAAYCGETIPAHDLYGNDTQIPRFQCNLALKKRRSAADLVRGVRNAARLLLVYGLGGKLELRAENTVAGQQPARPAGSNSAESLNGGWPCYEFGDGANGSSGILRKSNGAPSLRLWSRSTAETPNRLTLEFQDAFNEYQQDSLSLLDVDDLVHAGQEVSLALPALGVANFDQAARIAKFHLDKATTGNTYVEFDTTVRGVRLRPGDLITLTYLKEGLERQPFRITRVAPGPNCGTLKVSAQIHRDEWYADDNTMENSEARRQEGSGMGIPRPIAGISLDSDGVQQFEVTESGSDGGDGSTRLSLSAGFTAPAKPAVSGLAIPMVSLSAQIDEAGGTLAGDQTLYYAVSARNGDGEESGLSFTVRACIPPGTNANRVTLTGISFGAGTTGFNVYRGITPLQMLRVAENQPLAALFTDTGATGALRPPPDANYDHANFYWRLELQPEHAATIHTSDTIGNATLAMTPNWLNGKVARITKGAGAGQERVISSNTATTLTITPKWDVTPDGSSRFVVAESAWQFGAQGASSPVTFEVPTRVGATVHISGRAANAHNLECPYELSPLTRWRISGGGAGLDEAAPGRPTFALTPRGGGSVELSAIGFEELTNTRTISSATVTLTYWNELSSPSPIHLATWAQEADVTMNLDQAGGAAPGALIQIGSEVMRVEESLNGGTQYRVTRGVEGSAAAVHLTGDAVYHLSAKTVVIPFPREFFGSPASGSFGYPILLPDARIASVSLFVTNALGSSEPGQACYTSTTDGGLRTLSGGQFTIQVDGHLAIQTNAAPPLIVQESHSVRDIFAVVNEAPAGAPVDLEVRVNGELYCALTIPVTPPGTTYSNVAGGFGLPPLVAGSQISLDIVGVGQTSDAKPGCDLTVMIRL